MHLGNRILSSKKMAARTGAVGLLVLAPLLLAVPVAAQVPVPVAQHAFFHVSLGSEFKSAVSGRLLVFIAPASADAKSVDVEMMSITSVTVAAREVAALKPGETVDIDADDIVFPRPLSQVPAGNYSVQAVLDVHHSYNYDGRSAGDLVSAVTSVAVPFAVSAAPDLTLAQTLPGPPDPLAQRPDVDAALKPVDFISPVLSEFWGRDIHMRAWVLLPPGYAVHSNDHYPTVYFTHGFGGTLFGLRARDRSWDLRGSR